MNIPHKVKNSIMTGPYQGWARALVDYVPSPYDKVALPFRSGELIHLTGRGEGGMWWGECGGRRGAFKCVNVEVLNDFTKPKENRKQTKPSPSTRGLLASLGLSQFASRLELNGFDSLEKLKNISREDLEFLEIEDNDVQDKIITAGTVITWMKGRST